MSDGQVCSVAECDLPVRARGWCHTHHERWRYGGHGEYDRAIAERCRCDMCGMYRREHREEWDREQRLYHERQRRLRRRLEAFPSDKRRALTVRLRDGATVAEACEAVGITTQALWEYAEMLPAWGARLERTLMEMRAAGIHGTERMYKKLGCRCRDCRGWNAARTWRERHREQATEH